MKAKITVCIVEDRKDIRESLAFLVHAEADCQCLATFPNAELALICY